MITDLGSMYLYWLDKKNSFGLALVGTMQAILKAATPLRAYYIHEYFLYKICGCVSEAELVKELSAVHAS